MKLNREWITPVLTGAFALMATTGILMFFHLDSGLNKLAHEWLGWLMVAAVALHLAVSWFAFKRYFVQKGVARPILVVSVLVIAATFLPLGGGNKGPSPPMLALRAVVNAPLVQVAPLTGRTVEQLVAELKTAGFDVLDVSKPLSAVTGRDREREGRALSLMFGAAAQAGAPK